MERISRRTLRLAVVVAGIATPTWLVAQNGEDGAFDRTPQNCLILQTVDKTEVVDDQNIIFKLRNDKLFRNTLPRKCPNRKSHRCLPTFCVLLLQNCNRHR